MSFIVENLSFSYSLPEEQAESRRILDNVNLTVKKGEFVVLTGPSGCGKSTLALALVGLIPNIISGNMQGKVVVNGLDASTTPIKELSRHVGLIFQNPDNQLFSLKVIDEVAFGLENRGFPKEEMEKRIERIITDLCMEKLRDRFVFTLSGRQKQRVAIATNLVTTPEILILDEPTSDLDLTGTSEIFSTLKKLCCERKITILLIEHRLEKILDFCVPDRILIMNNGKIVLDKPPRELFEDSIPFMQSLGIEIPQSVLIYNSIKTKKHEKALPLNFEEISEIIDDLIEKSE